MIQLFKDGDHFGLRAETRRPDEFHPQFARLLARVAETPTVSADLEACFQGWVPLAMDAFKKFTCFCEEGHCAHGRVLNMERRTCIVEVGHVTGDYVAEIDDGGCVALGDELFLDDDGPDFDSTDLPAAAPTPTWLN